MEDRYGLTVDRLFCDPSRRSEFDVVAQGITPGIDTYVLRKAALGLRKRRRLQPELIKRVTDWGREVVVHAADELWDDPELLPLSPGIYLFLDRSGYLYIGESENLRKRVAKHLDHSDRKALAHYFWEVGTQDLQVELHVFRADSDARRQSCRRAYESELIRSRRPRFNLSN
jgi:hypothetical protein